MLTDIEIQTLIDKIAKRMEPEKIIIFGSYAKGTATARSDLDLLVIKDTHLPMRQRNAEVQSFLANLLIKVDVHIYTPEEVEEFGMELYSFIHSVMKTGRVVYEQ